MDGELPTTNGFDSWEPATAEVETHALKEAVAAVVTAGQRGEGVGKSASSGSMRKMAG